MPRNVSETPCLRRARKILLSRKDTQKNDRYCFEDARALSPEDGPPNASERSRVCIERPAADGAGSDGTLCHWPEVAAIETVGVFGGQEQLASVETSAAVPTRHGPPTTIATPEACEPAAHIDASPEAADEIAAHGRYGLQEVRRSRQIAATRRQRHKLWRQSNEDSVSELRRSAHNAI
jgi:hypothetical protein